jgi:hypothetical protein
MSKWVFLTSIAVTLSGCCDAGMNCGVTPPNRLLARDNLSLIKSAAQSKPRASRIVDKSPRAPRAAADRSSEEPELAALPKYSQQWWSVHDRIEAEADAKLARAIMICRGCLPADADEQTGAVSEWSDDRPLRHPAELSRALRRHRSRF